MKRYIMVIIMVIFILTGIFSENKLSPETMDIINESVFEVVISKMSHDSLTYEKELPTHLLPFSVRNDDYISIGTAFAVSSQTFLSAAHVFFIENESQYEDFFIRDREGNVYEVTEVYKYSNHKDFILFTVKDKIVNKTLPIHHNPQINEDVYAVGNALGDGIIIRDGTYTSQTPEKVNGQWNWYRFSAPASPGNSGGPLLDKSGGIIGVITMKSSNENLNYALPISEVLKSPKLIAESKRDIIYSLANITNKLQKEFYHTFILPLHYKKLQEAVTSKFNSFCQSTLNSLLKENKETLFPNGKGALNLLYSSYNAVFPRIIGEGEDGNWNAYYPKEINSSDLGDNGSVKYGGMLGFEFVYLKKPDNVTLMDLCTDSKLYMDLLLKGISFQRNMMNQDIRITSLGKAIEEEIYIDNYHRKWLVRSWLLEYNDSKLVSFSMLVPEGMISILKLGQTGEINTGYIPDLKALTDFAYLSLYGNFQAWDEYLKAKDYLPEVCENIEFQYEIENEVFFKSSRFSFNYNKRIFEISEKSNMTISLTYYKENNNIVWDISNIVVKENSDNQTFLSINKHLKPEEGLNDSFFTSWNKIMKKEPPFNYSSNIYEGNTYVYQIHDQFHNLKSDLKYVYYTLLHLEGEIPEYKIKKKSKDINLNIDIFE